MREVEYRLVKEDYKDWIHWNVERNYSEKKRRKTLLIYGLIILAFVGMSIVTGKGLNGVIPTLILGVAMGWYLMRTTSFQSQEKMIWKRSGLEKLDKTGNYPTVHLTLKDRGLVMEVADQNLSKMYGYSEIVDVTEISRLYLLETTDKTWQFVSKSAFDSEEEKETFIAFLKEKIAAAKENPEEYSQAAMKQETAALSNDGAAAEEEKDVEDAERESTEASADVSDEESEVEIEPVDTSNMGKIGKMAHIMAAMAAEAAEESEEADTAEAPESSENVEETENENVSGTESAEE